MSWLDTQDRAAERAAQRRNHGGFGAAPAGLDEETWFNLCHAIDASGWLTGRILSARAVQEIAHAAVAVLRPIP